MGELERSGAGLSGGDMRTPADPSPETFANVERSDLAPRELEPDETLIVVQRHGKYERDKQSEEAGKLTEKARVDETVAAKDFLEKQLALVPEADRDKVDFLFVASDTQYGVGQRSLETANIVLETARSVLEEHGLGQNQILNNSSRIKGGDESRTMPHLREPQIFDQSWDFVQFLKETYDPVDPDDPGTKGFGPKFWGAFEEDLAKEKRMEMGAEGPDDLADRLKKSMDILARFARRYHSENPDRRLVIWAASHYDTITQLVKRDLYGAGKEQFVGVDYGAGITVKVDKEGNADTIIDGKRYQVPLAA